MFDDNSARPSVKVCCGPRCGTTPHHRQIFDAVEQAAQPAASALPTMCQGWCQGGVTVVWPDKSKAKIRDAKEAAALTAAALFVRSRH